jgi:DNA-binding transcriptional regulator YiaG
MVKIKPGVKDTDFGRELLTAFKEVRDHRKGKIALPTREVEIMSAARVKQIRKSVARSPIEFCKRFGVPARTVEGWEQGKKVDVAARVLLMVIEKYPEAVEKALSAA